MSLASTPNGDHLLIFRPGVTALEEYPDLPLVFACVVAHRQGKVLFVYNRWRKEWELPSGLIEPGETPHAAAIRELKEESGQSAALTDVGVILLRLPDGRLEFGTIHTGELDELQPFTTNEETDAILLWDLQSAVEGRVNDIARKLAELVLS